MYAYIDESGNTGKNLFDKAQPLFVTAALVTKENFDVKYKPDIMQIAQILGETSLHANILGIDKIEQISQNLLEVLVKSEAKFFLSSVDKSYLATTKLIDTLFDSHDNKAVSFIQYNYRPLRLLLVANIASFITDEIAIGFWNSILESNEETAYAQFEEILKKMKSYAIFIPDERAKEIITDAIDWAIKNPKSINIHTSAKSARKGHLPNMVVFPNLLRGIDDISKQYKLPIDEVIHDRQNEFQKILEEWHGLFSNAAPDVISWPGEEEISIQCVAESKFSISKSEDSVGIQTIDTLLWLYKRFKENKTLGKDSLSLVNYMFDNGGHHEISFDSLNMYLSEYLDDLYSKPISDQQMIAGKDLMKEMEGLRKKSMAEYAKNNPLDENN